MLKSKHYTLVLLFSLIITPIFGQSSSYDSLLNRHLDTHLSDRHRLDALIELGATPFIRIFPDSLITYHHQANSLFEEVGRSKDLMLKNLHLGQAHFYADQNAKSIDYLEVAADMALVEKDTLVLIKALNWQGNLHGSSGNYKIASKKYLEGLELAEVIEDQKGIYSCLGNLGNIFTRQRDFDKARYYFGKTLEGARKQGDLNGEVRTIMNFGFSYLQEGKYEKALEYFFEALESAAAEPTLIRLKIYLLQNISHSYMELGEMDHAKKYIRAAQEEAVKGAYSDEIALVHFTLANIYKELMPDSALYYALKTQAFAIELDKLGLLIDTKLLISQLYKEEADFQKALDYYTSWQVLQDSINKKENQQAAYEAEARYEYEKQKLADQLVHEKELARQQLLFQRKLFLLIGLLGASILFFLILLRNKQYRSDKERNLFLHEIDLLRERVAVQSVTATGVRQELRLNKEKLEVYLDNKLGESSWKILNILFENPSVSNKEIAQAVHLSLEGVSSALRRMYKAFKVTSESNRNLKVVLITKAVKISLDEIKS